MNWINKNTGKIRKKALPVHFFRASNGAVVYRIEPANVPFDVTPFSGDIFSRYGISNGRYLFSVIATDSIAQVSQRDELKDEAFPVFNQQISVKKTFGTNLLVTFAGKLSVQMYSYSIIFFCNSQAFNLFLQISVLP